MINRLTTKDELLIAKPAIANILVVCSDDDVINLYKDNLFTCLQSIIRRSKGDIPCLRMRIVDEGAIHGDAYFITVDDAAYQPEWLVNCSFLNKLNSPQPSKHPTYPPGQEQQLAGALSPCHFSNRR